MAHEFHVQVTPLWQGMAEIGTLMVRLNDTVETTGEPRPKIMQLHYTYVASDAEDADLGARELSRFYNYFGAWLQNRRPVRAGLIEQIPQPEMNANAIMATDALCRDLTIGTAQEIVDRLKRIEDLGYDEFSIWIDSGMSFERKRASLDRFIDKVMPALPERKFTDHFSLCIAGEFTAGSRGRTMQSINFATGALWASIARADP